MAVVVGLGALCDLADDDGVRPQCEYALSISEFAVTVDGRRVVLYNERGWGSRLSIEDDIWRYTNAAELKETTFAVVRFTDDEDLEDDHPWEWLVDLCRSQGLEVTVAELQAVPYEVLLSDRVIERLASSGER